MGGTRLENVETLNSEENVEECPKGEDISGIPKDGERWCWKEERWIAGWRTKAKTSKRWCHLVSLVK